MRRQQGVRWVAVAGLLLAAGLPKTAALALAIAVAIALGGERRSGRDRRSGSTKGPRRLRRAWPPSERRPRWARGDDLADLWDDLQRRPRRD
jgi:hypothetical protein